MNSVQICFEDEEVITWMFENQRFGVTETNGKPFKSVDKSGWRVTDFAASAIVQEN